MIHNADRKSVTDIAREVQELAEKGRNGKLFARAEIERGDLRITSLGALGGVLSDAHPQLSRGGNPGVSTESSGRPVYRADGTIGPADLMNLSISLDHRVLDGARRGAVTSRSSNRTSRTPHQLFAELA